MANSNVKDTQKTIAMAMLTKRPEVIALLKKHGVVVSSAYSDEEIIIGILEAMRTNDRFKSDLAKLLATVASENHTKFTGGGMFQFTGETMFALTGPEPGQVWLGFGGTGSASSSLGTLLGGGGSDESSSSSSGSSAAGSTTSSTSKPAGFFTTDKLNTLFNTGLNILSTSLTNKGNKDLAKTALEIEQEKTKQAEALAAAGVGGNVLGTTGLSTGAKIGIGVGIVAVVGTIVYLIVRKKSS